MSDLSVAYRMGEFAGTIKRAQELTRKVAMRKSAAEDMYDSGSTPSPVAPAPGAARQAWIKNLVMRRKIEALRQWDILNGIKNRPAEQFLHTPAPISMLERRYLSRGIYDSASNAMRDVGAVPGDINNFVNAHVGAPGVVNTLGSLLAGSPTPNLAPLDIPGVPHYEAPEYERLGPIDPTTSMEFGNAMRNVDGYFPPVTYNGGNEFLNHLPPSGQLQITDPAATINAVSNTGAPTGPHTYSGRVVPNVPVVQVHPGNDAIIAQHNGGVIPAPTTAGGLAELRNSLAGSGQVGAVVPRSAPVHTGLGLTGSLEMNNAERNVASLAHQNPIAGAPGPNPGLMGNIGGFLSKYEMPLGIGAAGLVGGGLLTSLLAGHRHRRRELA